MREILFRGKRISNGEWVEGGVMRAFHPNFDSTAQGFAMQEPNCYCICANYKDIFVEQNTIGQYTGLQDKNGKRIFEGDIVRDMDGTTYPVVWGGTGFYLRYAPPHAHGMECELLPLCNYWHAHGPIIEIIGNIHDNQELIDGGAE